MIIFLMFSVRLCKSGKCSIDQIDIKIQVLEIVFQGTVERFSEV